MKRKLLSVLLVLAMVLAILPVGAMAAEEKPKGEFTYTIGYWAWGPEATITGYTDLDVTDLVIPETIDGNTVTGIGQYAFEKYPNLKSVVIPKTVTRIGASAFDSCTALENVDFQCDYLEEMEIDAFYGCTSLKSVVVPRVDTIIQAFYMSTSLETVILSEGPRYVDMFSFIGCESLKLLYIPASVDVMDRFDSKLENLTIVGLKGTTAERYANEYGYPFEAIDYPDYFEDVTDGHYYSTAVEWASQRDFAYGYEDGCFRPDRTCTRWQMVMFLWRLNGSQDMTGISGFLDVPEDAIYHDAVYWARSAGIIKGYSDEYFAPNEPVTRAMVVTMLWRMNKKPEHQADAPDFSDVKPAYYYEALAWAQEAGVAEGYPDGSFHPNETCTRGQIVTLMYRNMPYFYDATTFYDERYIY